MFCIGAIWLGVRGGWTTLCASSAVMYVSCPLFQEECKIHCVFESKEWRADAFNCWSRNDVQSTFQFFVEPAYSIVLTLCHTLI